MSVKTRQAPKVRPALSQVRQWPWVWQAAAALGGFAAARAPVFGGLLPLGLCAAAAMPPAYVLSAGTGAALGYVLGLSSPTAAAYLGAVLAVVALRLLGGAQRYRDVPMAPLGAGGVCYCLLHAGLGVAAGGGLTAILAGAAEALLILGLGYFLTVFFAHPVRILQQSDPEARCAVYFALMGGLVCLAPLQPFGFSPAHAAGAFLTLAAAWKAGPGAAAVTATTAAVPRSGDKMQPPRPDDRSGCEFLLVDDVAIQECHDLCARAGLSAVLDEVSVLLSALSPEEAVEYVRLQRKLLEKGGTV